MTNVPPAFAAGVVMVGVLLSRTVDAQTNQRLLAQQLLGQDSEQRTHALNRVRAIRAAEMGDELRLALVSVLSAKNETVRKASQRGQALDEVDDPFFLAALSREVARLRDARAIPALSEAIYGGTAVTRALAEFGEAAVPDLLRVVNSPDAHYNLVDHGLIALRMMVESPDYARTRTQTHQQIRDVAAQRLQRPGYFTTLWRAIDLAAVLRDPELRQELERLASSPGAIIATGIGGDTAVIEITQKRAVDRLSGVPPTPRF